MATRQSSKKKKTAAKRVAIRAPQTREEANEFLRRIGQIQRDIATTQNKMNTRIENIKAEYTKRLKGPQKEFEGLVEGLYAFAASHRDELTDSGKRKTVELAAGSFRWRLTPKSVAIRGVKAVIAKLKELGLERFIRTREDVNKEAMLKEEEVAAAVDGVEFCQTEEFFIQPAEVSVDITAVPKKKKVAIKAAPREDEEPT